MATITKNQFLKHNGIFFAGSMMIGALNYAYYPLLGRLLKVEAFGEVQVLFSFLTQVGILYAALSLVLVHAVVNKSRTDAVLLLEEVEKLGLVLFIPLAVLWLLVIPTVSHFLHFGNRVALLPFFLVVVIAFFISTRQAVIQGCEGFLHLTVNGIVGAVLKLGGSIGLVLLGWSVLGAVGGLLVAQLVMLGYVLQVGSRYGFPVRPSLRVRINWSTLRREGGSVVPIFVVSLAVTALFSSDVIIIKHLFSPPVAGQYAGVAAIGRIIIFLTTPFAAVLFTKVKPAAEPRANRKALGISLGLLLATGGVATAAMIVAPRWLIGLMLGDRYLDQAAMLPLLALALLCLSVVNLVAYYDLALRRRSIMYITLAGIVEASMLLILRHASIRQVIIDILLASITMIVIRLIVPITCRMQRFSS